MGYRRALPFCQISIFLKVFCFFLQQVNDVASTQFETESVITEALDLMNRLILPSVTLLTVTSYQDDQSAVEDVREKWCSFLGDEVSRK